jgi:hypothetical protein
MWPLLEWARKPHVQVLREGALLGAVAFGVTFGLLFLFTRIGGPKPRPHRKSK